MTDAAVLLGYIDAEHFLGGRLALQVAAARVAFEGVAARLDMTLDEAAHAAMVIHTENIVGAIREITIAQGIDPREMTIVAGGGASGLNIVPIARELGCRRVLLPSTAAALSACGAMYSDVISEFPVSRYAETRAFDFDEVNDALATAEGRADEFLASLAETQPVAVRKEFAVEARYRSQVWELDVSLPGERVRDDRDVEAIEQAFHDTHERVFAVKEPGQYIECLIWKARAVAELSSPSVRSRRVRRQGEATAQDEAPAYFGGAGSTPTPRFDGAALPEGAVVAGPAIVREPTTTVVVHPGCTATVTPLGNYVLDTAAEPPSPPAEPSAADSPQPAAAPPER